LSRYVFDIETDGLLPELTTIHSLVLKDLDTGTKVSCSSVGFPYSIEHGVELLQGADLIVGHNVIKFDVPAIQKLFPQFKPRGEVRDTLVLTRLLYPDIRDRDFKRHGFPKQLAGAHGLEAWGHRLGKWKGDYAEVKTKEARAAGIKSKPDIHKYVWGSWNAEMQAYCEQDVEVTAELYSRAAAYILANNIPEDAVKLEHGVAHIVARQERYGFGFDVAKAAVFHATLVAHRTRLEDELQKTFKPKVVETVFIPKGNNKRYGYVKGVPFIKRKVVPFNPGSRQQMAERLQELGWEPEEFGKDGIPKVDDETLQLLPWPEAKLMAEYAMVQKRIGALASGKEAWLNHERNGRIHGQITTCGTPTARMTHQHPNVAQVPAITSRKTGEKQPYGKECRELFIATNGKVLVGCDADALELRDLAGYMARYDGGEYIKIVLEGKKENGTDMHSVNARALGAPRDTAKVWFYAWIYGAGDYKLGLILGVQGSAGKIKAAGKASRRKFERGLPALAKLGEAVRKRVAAQGWLKGLDGRRIHIRSEHSALNFLLQSAGAIQMKRALVILDAELQAAGYVPGVHYEFVANVHDEWQIEVLPEIAQYVGEVAADAIRKAGEYYEFRCPLKGNFEVGNSWADTH
jgi:DNA polymerase-1